MTDADVEDEEGDEEEADLSYPDTLCAGQAFFYPELGTFCEQRGAAAVYIAEDGEIWLYPDAGGPKVNLSDCGAYGTSPHGKPH